MLFKTRELSQIIRPVEILPRSEIKSTLPVLETTVELQDVMIFDVNSNEDLITNMRDQWKQFFFEDLQYFSWNNFVNTIKIFYYGANNGLELLTQTIKTEVFLFTRICLQKKLRFQLKEERNNKNPMDIYKRLNQLFKRIFLLQKHISHNLNLGAIVLPIVNEELNNLQAYWQVMS